MVHTQAQVQDIATLVEMRSAKQAEAQGLYTKLQELQGEINELTLEISHRQRTPLAAAHYAKVIEFTTQQTAQQQGALDVGWQRIREQQAEAQRQAEQMEATRIREIQAQERRNVEAIEQRAAALRKAGII